MKIKKILKWVLIIFAVWTALGIVIAMFDDEEESEETQTASVKTEKVSEKEEKPDLSVSDFKLNKGIEKAVKTLRSKGWRPGDGEDGECGSEYSGYLSAYGYVKQDGRFEGYHIPFISVSFDEYGNLAHFRVVIKTTVNSEDYKKLSAELERQEKALFEKIDDGKNTGSGDFYAIMESVENAQKNITPEIQAQFDEIYEKQRILAEETQKAVEETKTDIFNEIAKKCILQYGYSPYADENEKADRYGSFVIGFKNSGGDICKMKITETGTFTTSYTLDYVSARFRNEEKLAAEILKGYYGR